MHSSSAKMYFLSAISSELFFLRVGTGKTRLYIILVLCLCYTNPISAQMGKTSILKAGVGINFFSNHNGSQSVPIMGVSVGLSPTLPLSKRIYLRPEISFSMKGGRIDYLAGNIFNGNVRYHINYLEVPVMIGIQANAWLALEAGAYGAIKLGGNFDFQGSFTYGYGIFDRDDLEDFDYGSAAGVVLKTRFIQIGIRYYHGLNSVADNEKSGLLLGDAVNNTVQLCIQTKRFRRNKG